MSQSQKLKPRLIEMLLIVGSILLAFAIDAAWQSIQEDQTTSIHIASLTRDAERNLALLDRIIGNTNDIYNSNVLLKNYLSNPDSIDHDELVEAFGRFTAINSYNPDNKAFDQLVASGDIRLLSQEVQESLSYWNENLSRTKEIEINATDARTNTTIVQGISQGWLATALHLLQFDEIDETEIFEPKFDFDFPTLVDNREFEGILYMHLVFQGQTLTRYQRLRESLVDLISELESN